MSRGQLGIADVLKRRAREGALPPQKCGSQRCGVSLRDDSLPPEWEKYRLMFSLALERPVSGTEAVFECPVCGWRTRQRHRKPSSL